MPRPGKAGNGVPLSRRTADHRTTEAILDRRTQRLAKGTTTKVHPPEKISVLCKILYSILECPDQGKQETVSLSPDVQLTTGLPRRTGNWQRDPHQSAPPEKYPCCAKYSVRFWKCPGPVNAGNDPGSPALEANA